jgi:hypothetical protein
MSKIIDAEDLLADARNCVECVFMAAGKLPKESRDAIQVVADIATTKINAAIALLDECLGETTAAAEASTTKEEQAV